jgi:hypothetical protein
MTRLRDLRSPGYSVRDFPEDFFPVCAEAISTASQPRPSAAFSRGPVIEARRCFGMIGVALIDRTKQGSVS